MTSTPLHDNPPSLWTFSLERYAKPGVQHAAIELQEALGADVNLLFFCMWHAMTGRGRLGTADFEKAETRIAGWRNEVTLPLRSLRTIIKNNPDLAGLQDVMDVREKILGAEVESERIAQIEIESMAGPPAAMEGAPSKQIAEANLRTYLAYINVELDADTAQHFECFLNGAFS